MAIKTFTSGEVLTSADTNTYLANSGLVYIAEGSTSTSVLGLNFNNVFTSTYDNYRIMIDYFKPVTAARFVALQLRVGGADTATNYYYAQTGIYRPNHENADCCRRSRHRAHVRRHLMQ
jgi:hypothetical protein